MVPYFYKIRHNKTSKIYVGCQYGRRADPKLFWKSYFTSSKEIKRIITEEGIDAFTVEKITLRADAREYERRYLKKAYSILGKNKFLNIFINRNLAPGILQHPSEYERRKKLWVAFPDKKPIPPNWKNKKRSEHMKQKLSETNKGHLISEETRKKISASLKGNIISEATKDKRRQTILEKYGSYTCCGIPKNTWEITHPCGKIELVNNLNQWCKIHDVKSPNLRRGKSKGFLCRLIHKKN